MRSACFHLLVLAVGMASTSAAQAPKAASKAAPAKTAPSGTAPAAAGPSVSGVFVGRSGKPMANARLFLGTVKGDEDVTQAKIILKGLPSAKTDAQGQFGFVGFQPDEKYTIVYYPTGSAATPPPEFAVKAIVAVMPSTLPLMKNVEIGGGEPLAERRWGPELIVLKGHRFWGYGQNMKLWKATLRRGAAGPYFELREGEVWRMVLKDKAQIKLEAWSF